MPRKVNIAVPVPCHENWDAMTPTDKGRFCNACQKQVHDFTRSSDREIALALKNNNAACGRFRNNQLNRDLVIQRERNPLWAAASAVVVSVLTLGNTEAVAQENLPTEQSEFNTPENSVDKTTIRKVHGVVISKRDGFPASDVIVSSNTSTNYYKTFIDGRFIVDAKTGDEIEFCFMNRETVTLIVDDRTNYRVEIDDTLLDNEEIIIVTGGVLRVEQRTFFGRIFHSIANWFR